MSIKNWILDKMNGVATRGDLPRSPVLSGLSADMPSVIRRDARRSAGNGQQDKVGAIQHLGPYAALIGTIREELEQFVVSYLSLHLAIAERDRYLLTSIEVSALAPHDDELLRRFIREFKPEQIKRYLAREVIAGLPNASALDLSQFAGLNAGRGDDAEEEEDDYSELLAELRSADATPSLRRYEVNLIGRWSEMGSMSAGASSRNVPVTPLAGIGIDIRIEDADGTRHVTLAPAIVGRRYVIGKDPSCDVVVNGLYASRRHCEIWLDRGAWWVTDAGSTNGIRVERAANVLGRSGADAVSPPAPAVVELVADARIVLSARAEGNPAQYPRLILEVKRDRSAMATPIAPIPPLRATPSTPILASRKGELAVSAEMVSGVRTIALHPGALPISVGRSRNQSLVVDWTHEGVSGHHMEISAIDEEGVTVEVYGDNGVTIAGAPYPSGAHVRWKPGESMTLGRSIAQEPECRLTLTRQ
jgi:pSer/pThr/pTyr-binding forkhead associated (FHA) protein